MCVIMNYTDKIYDVFKYDCWLLTLLYTFHSDFFHNFFILYKSLSIAVGVITQLATLLTLQQLCCPAMYSVPQLTVSTGTGILFFHHASRF